MAILETIVIAFWAMLPAYVPNNAAVLAGGGRPIDGGRTWGDKRVLGDGKTWRGTAMGILAGLALAAVLTLVKPAASDALGFAVPEFTPLAALGLAGGAMLGDILASFLKRRSGRQRGAMFPVSINWISSSSPSRWSPCSISSGSASGSRSRSSSSSWCSRRSST